MWIVLTRLSAVLFNRWAGPVADRVGNSATEHICFHIFGFHGYGGFTVILAQNFVILQPFSVEVFAQLDKENEKGLKVSLH